jgi:CheY-like chemotaxis protein
VTKTQAPRTEVLIADSNTGRGRRVANALEAAGQVCRVAPHGAAGLEIALADQPRVIVAQVDLPLVDAGKLSEILRANPRTRSVRFLFLGGEVEDANPGGIGDTALDAHAELDDVLDAVSVLLERQQRIESLEARAGADLEFAGVLTELRPAEVLQMLHLRGATGRLVFEPEDEGAATGAGEVSFHEGDILAAEVGPIRGEKALFRMLDWWSGSFAFVPGAIEGGAEITTPTRSVLAEGLRQLQEWNRLAPKLPPLESPVKLRVERGELPHIVHPLTQEVLSLLEEDDRVGDIVDHCGHPDYQVLRTLHTLSERGIIEIGRAQIAPVEQPAAAALFNEAQCRRLRGFAQAGLGRDAHVPDTKLLVVATSEAVCGQFAALLEKVSTVELSPRYQRGELRAGALETLARIDVAGEFAIDLIHLPTDPAHEALWAMAGHGALGTIFLLDASLGESTARLAPVTRALTSLPDARTFHVALLGDGERLSPDELRENLSLLDEASLFLLPIASSKDPGSLLRSLFARIVP